MACDSCNDQPIQYQPLVPNAPCSTGSPTDTSLITYSGPNLTCSGATSGSTLQTVLGAIDTAICAAVSTNWNTFNYACLPTLCSCNINSAQSFAETISSQFCILNSAFSLFAGTTYVAGLANIQSQINALKVPGLTSCAAVGIVNTDTMNQTLTKIFTNLCTVDVTINPSTANWGTSCIVTSPAPTNITDAFNAVLSMICTVQASIPSVVSLPTFNNVGTCLSSPGTTDSLSATVIKIRTLLCTLPTYDHTAITTTCLSLGSTLQSAIQTLATQVDTNTENSILQVDSNFSITNVDNSNLCLGKKLNFTGGAGTDRFVAVNSGDTSPGTLVQKILGGTNVSLDTTTTPGFMTINAQGPNNKVGVTNADPSPDYLEAKLNMKPDSQGIISFLEQYNSGTTQLDITPTISNANLAQILIATIAGNSTLLAQFNSLVCSGLPCTSTTTTTLNPNQYIKMQLFNSVSAHPNVEIRVTASQASPTLPWYDSGAVTVPYTGSGPGIVSGLYLITASTPVGGTVTLTNNHSTTIGYSITVVDNSFSSVPGSSVVTGTLATTLTYTNASFVYGTSTNGYNLLVDIETIA